MFVEQNSKNNPSCERLRGIDTLEILRFITHRVAIQDLLIGPQNYSDVARWPSWSSSISQSLIALAKIRHSWYDSNTREELRHSQYDGLRLNTQINAMQRSRAIWSRRSTDETIRRIDQYIYRYRYRYRSVNGTIARTDNADQQTRDAIYLDDNYTLNFCE